MTTPAQLQQLLTQAQNAAAAFVALVSTNTSPVPLAQLRAAQALIAQTQAAVRAACR